MMNLFENLQLMKENKNVNLSDEQIAVINIANDDIDGYEGGSKPFKYSYTANGYQDALNYIKDVMELSDSELQEEIDNEIRNISLSHEYESKQLKENQELYSLPDETQVAILSDFDNDKPIYQADGTDSIKFAIESAIWQAVKSININDEELVINISKRKKTPIDDEGNVL